MPLTQLSVDDGSYKSDGLVLIQRAWERGLESGERRSLAGCAAFNRQQLFVDVLFSDIADGGGARC